MYTYEYAAAFMSVRAVAGRVRSFSRVLQMHDIYRLALLYTQVYTKNIVYAFLLNSVIAVVVSLTKILLVYAPQAYTEFFFGEGVRAYVWWFRKEGYFVECYAEARDMVKS